MIKTILGLWFLIVLDLSPVLAQWQRVNGPYVQGGYGSYGYQLLVVDTQVYAATANGVFTSTNQGENWYPINNGLPPMPVLTLAFQYDILVAGTARSGAYYSTDRGSTWSATNGIPQSGSISAFCRTDSGLIAACDSSIYRSIDNGITWKQLNRGLTHFFCFLALGHDVLGGTSQGVFRSTDAGTTWMKSSNGFIPSTQVNTIAEHNGLLVAATNDTPFFMSFDSGYNWTNRSGSIRIGYGISEVQFHGDEIWAFSDLGIYHTKDTGYSWSLDTTLRQVIGMVQLPKHSIALLLGGVMISEGGAWSIGSPGFGSLPVTGFGSIGSRLFAYSGYYRYLYHSDDGGMNWMRDSTPTPTAMIQAIIPIGGHLLLASSAGLFVSSDSGSSWMMHNKSLTDCWSLAYFDRILICSRNAESYLYSFDSGRSWDSLPVDLQVFGLKLMTTDNGIVAGGRFLFREASLGWQDMFEIQSAGNDQWAVDGDRVYNLGSYVYMTTNDTTWEKLCRGPAAREGRYTGMCASGTNIFISTWDSLYVSLDHGKTWSHSSKGLQSWNVVVRLLYAFNNTVFAASDEAGLYRFETPPISLVRAHPETHISSEIYPNPSSSEVRMSFELLRSSNVTIELTDVAGRRLILLSSKHFVEGRHEFTLDVRHIAPGPYNCTVMSEEEVSTTKLIIAR
jgi:photosystem II stability/assembly factor-like uncharacterized protein